MASIPNAGHPGVFGAPGKADAAMTVFGVDEFEQKLVKFGHAVPGLLRLVMTEVGLFGEKETKERTPVKYGVLRASIGHADPSALKGSDPDDTHAEKFNPANAVFDVSGIGSNGSNAVYTVTWGTNVEYAPYIEHGFSVHSRRLVYISGVGYRWVSPFTYIGAHMFHLGLEATRPAVAPILSAHLGPYMKAAGLA